TSNLYRADQYARLLQLVRNLFPDLGSDTEVTLEGIPQLFTREKLDAMRTAGCTRVSIGVQQLDDEMIAMSGRKQKAAQVFQTIAWCRDLGLAASIDLIFGWPRQTVAEMLRDLEAVVGAGVDHLTNYELNVGGRTDFALNRSRELPSIEETLEMYRTARDFLADKGYRQATTYDWERSGSRLPQLVYEEEWRHRFAAEPDGTVTRSHTWGWGFAGISHFFGGRTDRGWTYMNHTRVADYFGALEAGRFPIERRVAQVSCSVVEPNMRPVVVTGRGVVSPIGIGVDPLWKQLREGVSGVRRITKFGAVGVPSQIAAEVTGFDPEMYLPRRDIVRTDTFIHFALTATQQALADAKLEPSTGDARMGVSIGTALGGLPLVLKTYEGLLQEQMRGVNPYAMPGFLPNMAAGWVSMRTGARGPIACPTTACAAGAQAIGEAFRHIERDDADVMIAGGSDALISPFVVACFSALRALSVRNDAPAEASRPFD